MAKKTSKIKLIFLIIGFTFFCFILNKIGLTAIKEAIAKVGWYFIPIALMNIFWYFSDSLGWHYLLDKKISVFRLLHAQICGEAINNATPSLQIAGESIKGVLLSSKMQTKHIISTLIVDNTIKHLTSIQFIAIGFLLSLFIIEMPLSVKIIAGASILIVILLLFLVIFLQKKGLVRKLLSLLMFFRIPIKNIEDKLSHAEEIDQLILNLYKKNKTNFALCFFFHFLARIINALDAIVILYVLGYHIDFITAFVIQSMNQLVNFLFSFIPLAIGAAEGSHYILFKLLTLGATVGVIFSLIRRVRGVVWIGIGLLLMTFSKKDSSSI